MTTDCIRCGQNHYDLSRPTVPTCPFKPSRGPNLADYMRFQAALESIAANTCCDGCGEAARVARAALSPVAAEGSS